jgi:hypothetical protein
MVMQGKTQQEWHHMVPKEKGRGPRININFRYILPEQDETTVRGVRAFYKYMVSGDAKTEDWDIIAKTYTYSQIVKSKGPMYAFATKPSDSKKDKVPVAPAPAPAPAPTPIPAPAPAPAPAVAAGGAATANTSCRASSCATVESKKRSVACRTGGAGGVDGVSSSNSSSSNSHGWTCSACTYVNAATAAPSSCAMCGTKRAKQVRSAPSIRTANATGQRPSGKGVGHTSVKNSAKSTMAAFFSPT